METLRVGTRGSELARRQTSMVIKLLHAVEPALEFEIVVIRTEGDLHPERAIGAVWPIGGFTGAIERAVAAGEVDLAVHSLKDLPLVIAEGTILATPPRGPVHDVIVTENPLALARWPAGLRIGTSSPRRAAQIRRLGPAEIVPIRGNVPARLAKIGAEVDGVVLAAAGLERLGITPAHLVEVPPDRFPPAPGQGALALQAREDGPAARRLAAIHDEATGRAVTAERAFLEGVGGGCRTPAGAVARGAGTNIRVHGQLFAADGSSMVEGRGEGVDPRQVGLDLARELAALLERSGPM